MQNPSRRRDALVQTRVTARAKRWLEQTARAQGQTVAGYLRTQIECAAGGKPGPLLESQAARLERELAHVRAAMDAWASGLSHGGDGGQ